MAWGLAAGGVPGLTRTLELLRLEMHVAMASVGVSTVAELSPDYLRASTPPSPNPWPTGL
jgi:isopentenyl diphosphate isomerase/L-lactate dehydrogenase-like FMN-dependent dehydrogenase